MGTVTTMTPRQVEATTSLKRNLQESIQAEVIASALYEAVRKDGTCHWCDLGAVPRQHYYRRAYMAIRRETPIAQRVAQATALEVLERAVDRGVIGKVGSGTIQTAEKMVEVYERQLMDSTADWSQI
jgi:hypothetical protein